MGGAEWGCDGERGSSPGQFLLSKDYFRLEMQSTSRCVAKQLEHYNSSLQINAALKRCKTTLLYIRLSPNNENSSREALMVCKIRKLFTLPRPNSISSLLSVNDGGAPGIVQGDKLTPIVPGKKKRKKEEGREGGKERGKEGSKEGRKQASKHARKQASKQASKQARKKGRKEGRNVNFFILARKRKTADGNTIFCGTLVTGI